VKTASRIVGTAAFLAGYQCQDSPVYGAERRGAAVVAYARIADEPILERGVIGQPSLIVLADETLLRDPTAGVLDGQQDASAMFINTESVEPLIEKYQIEPPVRTFDVTRRTLELLRRASALSAGLGAAAARMSGLVSEPHLTAALREEFEHLDIPADDVEKNIQIGQEVFAALSAVELRPVRARATGRVTSVAYADAVRGTPSIFAAGNTAMRQTGTWRVERPVIDRDVCTACGLCFVQCPDGAIALDDEGYPVIDYDHCKGCMICRHLCPLHAIQCEKETQAW
jgi:pyruvate ferredoxin oxidoreductase gamma subunit